MQSTDFLALLAILPQGRFGRLEGVLALVDLLGRGRDRVLHLLGLLADGLDGVVDLAGAGGGAVGEVADLVGDHRKALPFVAGLGGDDRGVERQQFGVGNQLADHLDDRLDLQGVLAQLAHRPRSLAALVLDLFHLRERIFRRSEALLRVVAHRLGSLHPVLRLVANPFEGFADGVEVLGNVLHRAPDLDGLVGHLADAGGHLLHRRGGFQKLGRGDLHRLRHLFERRRQLP